MKMMVRQPCVKWIYRAASVVPGLIVLSLLACGSPCDDAVDGMAGPGPASLSAHVIEQVGVPSRPGKSMACVGVTMLDSENYADTLFHGVVNLREDQFRIGGLDARTVDLIVDRAGFFPAKYVDIELSENASTMSETVLMYRSNTPIAIPGQVGILLEDGVSLDDIRPLYAFVDGVKAQPSPGGYELDLPFRGTRLTRSRVEEICRNLVYSPYVKDARPLVNLTTVMRGL